MAARIAIIIGVASGLALVGGEAHELLLAHSAGSLPGGEPAGGPLCHTWTT